MMKAEIGKTFLYDTNVRVYSDYIYWMEIIERNGAEAHVIAGLHQARRRASYVE